MWCKIGNLMWSVLKSGCIKKKVDSYTKIDRKFCMD